MITSMNISPAAANPGGTATFTAEITNNGETSLDMPFSISIDYAGGAKGTIGTPTTTKGSVTVANNAVHWAGLLEKSEVMTVTIPVEIGSDATAGGTITVSLQAPSGWQVEGTSTVSATIAEAAKPVLTLNNTTSSTPVAVVTEYNHVATIENTGDADWVGGKVEIDFIANPVDSSTVVSTQSDVGTATVSGSVVSWEGNISHGTTVTITTVAKFAAEATSEATQKSSIAQPAGVESTGNTDATATCAGSARTAKLRR